MGLFSAIKEARGEAKAVRAAGGSLGTVPLPGKESIKLPAGSVRITYEQNPPKWSASDYQDRMGASPKIEVTVEGLEVKPVPNSVGFKEMSGLQRASFAFVEVPTAGSYAVETHALDDFYSKEKLNPKVLFDPDPPEGG